MPLWTRACRPARRALNGAAALGLCVWAAACSREPAPPASSAGSSGAAAPAPPIRTRAPEGRRFTTDSGVSFEIPKALRVDTRKAPASPDLEIVLVYPDHADADALWNDPERLSRGVVVLEVMPTSAAERAEAGFAARLVKEAAAAYPKAVTTRRQEGLALPAFRLDVSKPRHLRLYMFAPDAVIKLRAEAWSPEFDVIARSLRGSR